MKVLKLYWIDDMQIWAASASDNLKIIAQKYDCDLHVVHATNGDDIVMQLTMFDFDGVIMDYQMTPFNGDKYIADIRNEDHLIDVPIIFYSQNNSISLNDLVGNMKNITTVFRPNLEDAIREKFLIPK